MKVCGRFAFFDAEGNYIGESGSVASKPFTTPNNCSTAMLSIVSQVNGGTVTAKNVQIEPGTEATEYEPYIEPTLYTPNADGVVEGVNRNYPSATLFTDRSDVMIEAEYSRDIN